MKYLTTEHKAPPRHIERDGQLVPTAPLISRDDTDALAELGVYPHITEPGEAPLGYTDWVFADGAYRRAPAGTPEEIAAALATLAVPQSVTALEGLLAIDAAGLSAQYEAWATDPARTFAQKAFIARAQDWRRDDATLIAAAKDIGLDDAQLDALFIGASRKNLDAS